MKEPFKIGDRVAVYQSFFGRSERNIGLVIDTGNQAIKVQHDSGLMWILHPKQCRRLVKKERRRIWVLREPGFALGDIRDYEVGGYTEFVEVKKK